MAGSVAIMSNLGHITIPKLVRESLKLGKGTCLTIRTTKTGAIVLTPIKKF